MASTSGNSFELTASEPRARKLWRLLLDVKAELKADRVSLLAAGLSFYGMLALFPMLVALVSLYGLLADPSQIQTHLSATLLPEGGRSLVFEQLQRLTSTPEQSLRFGVIAGFVGALWGASSGVVALLRGINAAYGRPETRGFLRRRALGLAFTVGALLLAVLSLFSLTLLPWLFGAYGELIQLALSLGRWPILLLSATVGLSLLYRYAPNRKPARFRWVSWGSGIATATWLIASLALSTYAANFADYDRVYGTLGGVIGLMVWLYVSAYAVLLGAEVDAVLDAHRSSRA